MAHGTVLGSIGNFLSSPAGLLNPVTAPFGLAAKGVQAVGRSLNPNIPGVPNPPSLPDTLNDQDTASASAQKNAQGGRASTLLSGSNGADASTATVYSASRTLLGT